MAARTIQQIKDSIRSEKNAQAEIQDIKFSEEGASQTSKQNLWAFVVASAIYFHEKLVYILKDEIETLALQAATGTESWLQRQALQFQFSPTVPQIIELVDFVPQYQNTDPALKIITRCSVKQSANRRVFVKVAKGASSSLQPLTNDEYNAFRDYINEIKFAGTSVSVVSLQADRIKITADIYYKGQFIESAVKAAVITSIDNYLAALPFDGVVILSKLVDAIQATEGVQDVVLSQVKARTESVLITSNDAVIVARTYETSAGHIIAEDTTGHTLNDTLTMILST